MNKTAYDLVAQLNQQINDAAENTCMCGLDHGISEMHYTLAALMEAVGLDVDSVRAAVAEQDAHKARQAEWERQDRIRQARRDREDRERCALRRAGYVHFGTSARFRIFDLDIDAMTANIRIVGQPDVNHHFGKVGKQWQKVSR